MDQFLNELVYGRMQCCGMKHSQGLFAATGTAMSLQVVMHAQSPEIRSRLGATKTFSNSLITCTDILLQCGSNRVRAPP